MISENDFVSLAKDIATFLYNNAPEIIPLVSNNNQVMTALHARGFRDSPDGFQCLTHGDSLQLLTDGEGVFSVIDWEAASAGHALWELGYFLLAHKFWTLLQKQKGPLIYPQWRSRLLEGFADGTELTARQLTEIHILGSASCIEDALSMSAHNLSKTDDFFSFIENEDAALPTFAQALTKPLLLPSDHLYS